MTGEVADRGKEIEYNPVIPPRTSQLCHSIEDPAIQDKRAQGTSAVCW